VAETFVFYELERKKCLENYSSSFSKGAKYSNTKDNTIAIVDVNQRGTGIPQEVIKRLINPPPLLSLTQPKHK
jgi:hypothetical protein